MVLFKRLPKLWWKQPADEDVVPSQARQGASEFAGDFDILERELAPHFRQLNANALRLQNQFRLDQVLLIFGGALATVLGALHASLSSAAGWMAICESILAAGLSAVALHSQTTRAQERYFTDRLKAETLRAEYFLFLGRVGPYADEQQRLPHLIRRIAEVKTEERK
jgi:hypothetical protein